MECADSAKCWQEHGTPRILTYHWHEMEQSEKLLAFSENTNHLPILRPKDSISRCSTEKRLSIHNMIAQNIYSCFIHNHNVATIQESNRRRMDK